MVSALNGFTILVVDDERYIATTISLKLRQAGARVLSASDGCEALELARLHLPNLIVSDCKMPLMGGLELAVQLTRYEETAHMPVLMLTSRSYWITPTQMANTNIRAVLSKPFSARELLARIDEVFQESGIAA